MGSSSVDSLSGRLFTWGFSADSRCKDLIFPFFICPKRQILDLIWNLPALDVRHVPECGTTQTMPTQGDTVKAPPGDMAVQYPCFLVLNSNGWADFLPNSVLPFLQTTSF